MHCPDDPAGDSAARLFQFAALLAGEHHLSEEDGMRLALIELGAGLAADGGDLPPVLLGGVAEALGSDPVLQDATGLCGAVGIAADDGATTALARLLEAVVAAHPAPPAGVPVALARCHEADGDLAAMEAALRLGLLAEPDHVGANADLGALETLRGDFRTARKHLDAAGEPRWGWAALFESLGHGPVKAGRNHPCPCGSGARYKRCCQQTGGWSLADRAMLLPARVEEWLDRPANLRRRLPLACAAAGMASIHDDPSRVVDALMSDAVRGIHLFETGEIDRLVEELRPVLRPDEVPVLESWRGARHQVYEIGGRGRRGWLLRDVAGETRPVLGLDSDVVDQSSGWLWCALVPAWQRDGDVLLAGCEPVALVEGDARHLVDLLDAGAGAGELVAAVAAPHLAVAAAFSGDSLASDPAMAGRLRWLLGDTFELRHPRDLELVDDLVTTTYMRGGGFTVAGDFIRHAARQIVGGEPPEVWSTAERLERAGLDKGTILAELGAAWAIATAEAGDPSRVHHAHLARLAALPISTAA